MSLKQRADVDNASHSRTSIDSSSSAMACSAAALPSSNPQIAMKNTCRVFDKSSPHSFARSAKYFDADFPVPIKSSMKTFYFSFGDIAVSSLYHELKK